jgi:endonuclease/exonuclease/phosphatase family metal-dependent hydrolase
MDTLRVLSLNIWNRSGPWEARLPLLRAGLAAEAAHIVGLQEVMCMAGPLGSLSQLDDLAASESASDPKAGPSYPHRVYAPAWTIDSGSGFTMGNALLSQFPIVDTGQTLLPNPIEHETRSLLFALCQTPHGLQPVAVTHLDWQLDLSHARCQQVSFIVDALADWLAPHRQAGADLLPLILLGDFNAEPDSDEIRFLRGHHALPSLRTGKLRGTYFNDAVLFADGDAGPTFARDNVFAGREREPSRRIDYIFVATPDRFGRGLPLSGRRCFLTATDGVHPSDHYGVSADVQLAPSPDNRKS